MKVERWGPRGGGVIAGSRAGRYPPQAIEQVFREGGRLVGVVQMVFTVVMVLVAAGVTWTLARRERLSRLSWKLRWRSPA